MIVLAFQLLSEASLKAPQPLPGHPAVLGVPTPVPRAMGGRWVLRWSERGWSPRAAPRPCRCLGGHLVPLGDLAEVSWSCPGAGVAAGKSCLHLWTLKWGCSALPAEAVPVPPVPAAAPAGQGYWERMKGTGME